MNVGACVILCIQAGFQGARTYVGWSTIGYSTPGVNLGYTNKRVRGSWKMYSRPRWRRWPRTFGSAVSNGDRVNASDSLPFRNQFHNRILLGMPYSLRITASLEDLHATESNLQTSPKLPSSSQSGDRRMSQVMPVKLRAYFVWRCRAFAPAYASLILTVVGSLDISRRLLIGWFLLPLAILFGVLAWRIFDAHIILTDGNMVIYHPLRR